MSLDPRIAAAVRESFGRQALMSTIGASLDRVEAGQVDVAIEARTDLTQQHGFLHAAIVTALLDTACGYAALTLMPHGSDVLSVEFKVNLLRPATGDHFVARASVKRSGRNLTVTEADCYGIRDGHETLVATMLGTMIRAGEMGS